MKTWPTNDGSIDYNGNGSWTWIGVKAHELRAWIRTLEFSKQINADDSLLCDILDDTLKAVQAKGRITL